MDLCLDVRIPLEWARIDPIREAIGLCVSAVFGDALRHAVAMVSAELLENAVKYGSDDAFGIELSVRKDHGRIVVRVTNAVDVGSSNARELRERVAWLHTFASPSEAYLAALARVYERGGSEGASGLGLVRIAYEGGCKISCETTDDRVTVLAWCDLA